MGFCSVSLFLGGGSLTISNMALARLTMINKSNITSSTLKNNDTANSSRVSKRFVWFWAGAVCIALVFGLLVNLGFWQMSRVQEKKQFEKMLSERAKQPAKTLHSLDLNQAVLTGTRVKGRCAPIKDRYLLLDNQLYQGKVAYLAYQLMICDKAHYLLMERGFVGAKAQRDQLPMIHWLTNAQYLEGRLYQRSDNPLSDDLLLEHTSPPRIQNLNFEQLAQHWQVNIMPVAFQPQMQDWRYPQPWTPVPMGSVKHLGYAVQWFAMAAVLVVISGLMAKKSIDKREKDE